jgi:hypothetical protein
MTGNAASTPAMLDPELLCARLPARPVRGVEPATAPSVGAAKPAAQRQLRGFLARSKVSGAADRAHGACVLPNAPAVERVRAVRRLLQCDFSNSLASRCQICNKPRAR